MSGRYPIPMEHLKQIMQAGRETHIRTLAPRTTSPQQIEHDRNIRRRGHDRDDRRFFAEMTTEPF